MTTRERYERLCRLFAIVCDFDVDQRNKVLDRECAEDPALRAEIEALLSRDAEPGSVLEAPRRSICGE